MFDRARQFLFGYDAIENRGKRRPPQTRVKSEDVVLTSQKRQKLIGTAQDVQRNFAIAAWAIRQHLNYVSSFTFQSRTSIPEVDAAIEDFMATWGNRYNCDVCAKHPFRRMIRMAEARRVVDGDFFLLKLAGAATRGKLQAIEADRIDNPPEKEGETRHDLSQWTQGVKLSPGGAARAYAIHNRTENSGKEFQRTVPASNMFVHGFYDRFDQVRGISPIAAALNTWQDVYEGFDYALAKIKVAQLFGLVFYRDATEPFDGTAATLDSDDDGVADSGYEVNFSDGPAQLDLNPGDRAEFLESKSPPSEVVNFLQMMIQVSLRSLDIPYSFYDESFTNFYGSRGGLIQYLKSCRSKIQDMQDLLDDITRWRLGMAIADGELQLPRMLEFEEIWWEWVPDGVPWWDPSKEVAGHAAAIAAGLDNPQRVCRQSGTDYYENIDLIAQGMEYAKAKGVSIILPGVSTAQSQMDGDRDEPSADGDPNSDVERLKSILDAYGVGVRAGAITPIDVDEEYFRSQAGLPAKTAAVVTAWTEDGGIRRPITLQPKAGEQPPQVSREADSDEPLSDS